MMMTLGIGSEDQTGIERTPGNGVMEANGSLLSGLINQGSSQIITIRTSTAFRYIIKNMPKMDGMTIVVVLKICLSADGEFAQVVHNIAF